ncbi:short chain dehydrogenase [Colwellia sp. Arc7-635]|uniref:short chain dehydrogenase n=1 Tax=Colwellia sp. Arc7-635 TaxID=2497879 RepID=UPI000F84ECFA|nr:short chain dehydrogenase [Colwellia sp. Arc7-635]AZQ85170.1 short chain dehydrogenase [Colwellia sp. Arc7-635]
MKILLVGASGTIGQAVEKSLTTHHEIVTANYSGGDIQVDLGNVESIRQMFETAGSIDAIISTAGVANFASFTDLTETDYQMALNNKLMGQINLIRFGQSYINTGGSITLTSGILSREPMPGGSVISMANGALESFVKSVVLEVDRYRVNVVAPIFVKETMAMMGMDTEIGLSASDTAKAYVAAVTGKMHGQILDAPDYL